MFNNIGGKIKGLARILTWIGIVASVIIGFMIISRGFAAGGFTIFVGLALGLIVAAVGALLSWVGNFLLYGFGDLIETNAQTRDLLDRVNDRLRFEQVSENENAPDTEKKTAEELAIWYCTKCGKENTGISAQCKGCGEYRTGR